MKILKLLLKVGVAVLELFDFVALVRSINDALGADWVASASETVVGDTFV